MLLYFLNCQGYAQSDSCVITAEIRNKIENYINYNDKAIYKKKVYKSFHKN